MLSPTLLWSQRRQALFVAALAADVVNRTIEPLWQRTWERAIAMPPSEALGYLAAHARTLVEIRVPTTDNVQQLNAAGRQELVERSVSEAAHRTVNRLFEARLRQTSQRRAA